MSSPVELSLAKKNLSDVLGDSMTLYLQILKSWFRQKITRDDFDHEARKLLTSDQVHLHNQFLLAILTKCQTIGTAILQKDAATAPATQTSPQKLKKVRDRDKKRSQCPRVTFHQRFLSGNPLARVPAIQPYSPEPDHKGSGFVSREMLLPDVAMIHGRMIVTAWDYNLEEVEDDAIRLLLQAVEMQLKNILTAVLCRRNGYQLREKRFKHSFGTVCPPSMLQNSLLVENTMLDSEATSVSGKGVHMPAVRPTVETGIRDAAVQVATGATEPRMTERLNLYDLYDALQIHKSCLPSHSVYSIAMEKVAGRLFHPSTEEIDQETIHRQEVTLRRETHAQQAVYRS